MGSLKVALVGGIGSGKSTVLNMFSEAGCGTISLDAIGHEVLESQDVLQALAEAFGPQVVRADGSADRAEIAKAAFDAPEHTELLNAITHPPILAELDRRMTEELLNRDIVMVEVTSGEISKRALPWADALVAVSAPEDLRIARACSRGSQNEQDIRRRMAHQPTDEERESVADFVVYNDGGLDEARRQVDSVMSQLKRRCQAQRFA